MTMNYTLQYTTSYECDWVDIQDWQDVENTSWHEIMSTIYELIEDDRLDHSIEDGEGYRLINTEKDITVAQFMEGRLTQLYGQEIDTKFAKQFAEIVRQYTDTQQ